MSSLTTERVEAVFALVGIYLEVRKHRRQSAAAAVTPFAWPARATEVSQHDGLCVWLGQELSAAQRRVAHASGDVAESSSPAQPALCASRWGLPRLTVDTAAGSFCGLPDAIAGTPFAATVPSGALLADIGAPTDAVSASVADAAPIAHSSAVGQRERVAQPTSGAESSAATRSSGSLFAATVPSGALLADIGAPTEVVSASVADAAPVAHGAAVVQLERVAQPTSGAESSAATRSSERLKEAFQKKLEADASAAAAAMMREVASDAEPSLAAAGAVVAARAAGVPERTAVLAAEIALLSAVVEFKRPGTLMCTESILQAMAQVVALHLRGFYLPVLLTDGATDLVVFTIVPRDVTSPGSARAPTAATLVVHLVDCAPPDPISGGSDALAAGVRRARNSTGRPPLHGGATHACVGATQSIAAATQAVLVRASLPPLEGLSQQLALAATLLPTVSPLKSAVVTALTPGGTGGSGGDEGGGSGGRHSDDGGDGGRSRRSSTSSIAGSAAGGGQRPSSARGAARGGIAAEVAAMAGEAGDGCAVTLAASSAAPSASSFPEASMVSCEPAAASSEGGGAGIAEHVSETIAALLQKRFSPLELDALSSGRMDIVANAAATFQYYLQQATGDWRATVDGADTSGSRAYVTRQHV